MPTFTMSIQWNLQLLPFTLLPSHASCQCWLVAELIMHSPVPTELTPNVQKSNAKRQSITHESEAEITKMHRIVRPTKALMQLLSPGASLPAHALVAALCMLFGKHSLCGSSQSECGFFSAWGQQRNAAEGGCTSWGHRTAASAKCSCVRMQACCTRCNRLRMRAVAVPERAKHCSASAAR